MRRPMWNLVLALAGGLFVSVLGALVRGLFPRVPNSVKVVALVVLGLVIAIAASETWRCAAFTVVEGNRTSTLLAVMVLLAIGVIAFLVDQRTALRRELEETRHEREELRARFGVNAPTTVDYIGAGGIVDGYISPNSPWQKSSVFKWRAGRPDSAVARLWTANLAETAPRPARDRPTGRPTV